MSSAPQFSDVGKQARGVFGSGYNHGKVTMGVKQKVKEYDVSLSVSAKDDLDRSSLKSDTSISTKIQHVVLPQPISVSIKTDSNGNVSTDAAYKEKLNDEITVSSSVGLDLKTKKGKGGANCTYSFPFVSGILNANAVIDGQTKEISKPGATASACFGTKEFAIGCQVNVDLEKQEIKKREVVSQAAVDNLEISFSSCDGTKFGAGFYYKVRDTSYAFQTSVDKASKDPTFRSGVAFTCKYSKEVTFSAKLNSVGQVAGSFNNKVSPNLTLAASVMVDTLSFTGYEKHSIGLGISLS